MDFNTLKQSFCDIQSDSQERTITYVVNSNFDEMLSFLKTEVVEMKNDRQKLDSNPIILSSFLVGTTVFTHIFHRDLDLIFLRHFTMPYSIKLALEENGKITRDELITTNEGIVTMGNRNL